MNDKLMIGDSVKIVDRFDGNLHIRCNGVIERFTATQIVVRNEHGNISKFRKCDLKTVGYCWPYVTCRLMKA